jgi:hypothetical protein
VHIRSGSALERLPAGAVVTRRRADGQNLEWTRASAAALRQTGAALDAEVADLIERTLDDPGDPRHEAWRYQVFLLTPKDDAQTLTIAPGRVTPLAVAVKPAGRASDPPLGPHAAAIVAIERGSLLAAGSLIWNEAMSRATITLRLLSASSVCSARAATWRVRRTCRIVLELARAASDLAIALPPPAPGSHRDGTIGSPPSIALSACELRQFQPWEARQSRRPIDRGYNGLSAVVLAAVLTSAVLLDLFTFADVPALTEANGTIALDETTVLVGHRRVVTLYRRRRGCAGAKGPERTAPR